MAKKPISRVRRKKGAVLFAVIAIMALLIAMASTAYFTARSSYNSVISNYSYSQLYLSAISVSDMVVEAVINDSTAAATDTTGTDPTKNYYDSLRTSVLAMNTVGETMSAYSGNISNPSASEEDIIEELRNGNNPTVPGVVDGVVVNIELTSDGAGNPVRGPVRASDGVSDWYWFEYAYTFTTTAYYRDSTITVEDVIMTEKARLYTPDNPSGGNGGPGSPGYTNTITTPGGGNGSFSTFFTATGQKIEGGSIVRSQRTVKIKTHEISDDAFFQNKSTYFVNGNNNDFVGGITSTGSVYLEKFSTNITGDKNDWWIGEDLVMTNNNANNLNLTKDNNLYVGNDLVIAANGNITAKDIYVEGDLYIMGQATFNANLHVSGNIYYEMPLTTTDEDGNVITTAAGTAAADGVNLGSTRYDYYGSNGWSVNGTLDINGKVEVPAATSQWDPNYAKFTVNGQQVTIPSGTAASTGTNGIGTYDPAAVQIEYSNRIPNTDTDQFEDVTSSNSVAGAIESQVGTNTEYYNYTSPQSAYDNELNIDFTNLQPYEEEKSDGTKVILYYEYYDEDSGLYIKTEDADLNGNVSVTIPYDQDGYMIDIDADSIDTMLGPNVNITYNIETSDDPSADAMPVVLKNNILIDSDGDGEEDDPGFSWQGNNYNSNDNSEGTKVVAVGDGNIVLEMANIDENGNYEPYDPNNYDKYTVVTYVAGQKEVVGNEAQCGLIGGGGQLNDGNVGTMLQSGTSTPKDEYQNQIMLVSNLNDGIAVDMARQNNAFCGYIYAPNGELNNYMASGETEPIFGGMIVSTYNAELSKLYYAEPKPSTISNMLGSLDLWAPGGGSGGTTTTITVPDIPPTPPTPPPPPGPGNWGDPQDTDIWNFKGSNFVG